MFLRLTGLPRLRTNDPVVEFHDGIIQSRKKVKVLGIGVSVLLILFIPQERIQHVREFCFI